MAQSTDTTGGLWEFTKYFLPQRGPQNVPRKFLKNARWDEFRSDVGYYATVGSITIAVEFNTEHLCWVEVRHRRTEGRWHAHKIASDDLGLQIHVNELTPDELLQVAGDSDSSTPSTLTGQQIRERVQEAVMSQTTDSFEDRMSDEPLEYFGEPLDQFPVPNVLISEDDRAVDRPPHFEEPEDAQVRATQAETTTTIRLQPDLWRDPQEANIQRAAGENPVP